MGPEDSITHVINHWPSDFIKEPPSVTVRQYYFDKKKSGQPFADAEITNLARELLLPVMEVRMWLQHLADVDERRKAGAAKAAATRKSKRKFIINWKLSD